MASTVPMIFIRHRYPFDSIDSETCYTGSIQKIPAGTMHSNKLNINRLLSLILGLPWLEILAEVWKVGRKLWRGMADEGMYEVLEYESTLELHDTKGEKATFHKKEQVRYLQNNIIAYQDQLWSDGESPINYQCSPGVVVDEYRPANVTILLISLRRVRRKGEEDVFEIKSGINNGFVRTEELWQTTIHHRTRSILIHVIFPKTRPPKKIWATEVLSKRNHILPNDATRQLPDGRWQVTWPIPNPHLNERYNLHWRW